MATGILGTSVAFRRRHEPPGAARTGHGERVWPDVTLARQRGLGGERTRK